MAGRYCDIQQEVIKAFNIDICDGSKCKSDWSRMHAHVRGRRVCKWVPKNSSQATFDLLHEIGHIEANTANMRRCEQEFHATRWAIEQSLKYGICVSDKTKELYQEYIYRTLDRGIRRGGRNLPSREDLALKWN